MATGDQADIFARLKTMLPARWFGAPSDSVPIVDAVLQGIANVLAFVYSLYAYAKLQTRVLTATDGYLDMIAADFFGTSLPRKTGQSDASYRALILANLFREKATRNAVVRALTDLTGFAPLIVEPKRPLDTGGYGVSICGYGVAGAYGSLLLPFQAFVTAYRPQSVAGLANVAGYGISTAGYSQPSQAEYADSNSLLDGVSDADIFAAVDAVKPAATIVWTRITNKPLGTKKVVLTGSGIWQVPAGVTQVQVELIGGGQSGWIATNNNGGAGADYAKANSIPVSPGALISYQAGAGGSATSSSVPNNGGDTWFKTTATVLAKGGGSASTSIGDLIHAGGAVAFAGGGGAGGPNAPGNSSTSITGGHGDGAFGGAGGSASTNGGSGSEWGSAGAGGGGGGSVSFNGGAGGNYGAGGGGARSGAIAGAGARGVIVITYVQ